MKKTLLLFLLLICFNAYSQNKKNIGCNFYGENNIKYPDAELCNHLGFVSNKTAEKKVDNILQQVGLKRNFILLECPNIQNAYAINIKNDKKIDIRYIIYDGSFLSKIDLDNNTDWAAVSILAHEIAHHLNGHTLLKTGSRPNLELEADEFSGFVLNKLGATLEQAQIVFEKIGAEKETKTHPAKKDRLKAIEKGWNSAKTLTPITTLIKTDTVIVEKKIIEERIKLQTDTMVILKKDTIVISSEKPVVDKCYLELGLKFGSINVSGDVTTKYFFNSQNHFHTFGISPTVSFNLIKNIVYNRLQYTYGVASGFNSQGATGYINHSSNPWEIIGYDTKVYYNYKTNISILDNSFLITTNKKNKIAAYGFIGFGGIIYRTKIDALDKNNNKYDFSSLYSVDSKNISAIKNKLKNLLDGTYESYAETHNNRNSGESTFRAIMTAGFGFQFKIKQRVSFSIEYKWTYTGDDLIDGQRWQEWPLPDNGGSAFTPDFDRINFYSVGINYSFYKKVKAL